MDYPSSSQIIKCTAVILLVLSGSGRTNGEEYTTTFPRSESPLSEGGRWINGQTDGGLWADCMTTNGFAWGNDNRGVSYADPTALLTGRWGSNQTVSATVRVTQPRPGNGGISEIELRLRSRISANSNRGYEICFSTNPGNDYVQIVCWHGPRGVEGTGYNYVSSTSGHGASANGDVLSATVSNSTIRVFKNGALILTGLNAEWSDGAPGIGFYGDRSGNVGFSRFSASDTNSSDQWTPPVPPASPGSHERSAIH